MEKENAAKLWQGIYQIVRVRCPNLNAHFFFFFRSKKLEHNIDTKQTKNYPKLNTQKGAQFDKRADGDQILI